MSQNATMGIAPTRLRQIALVAKDLQRAEYLLTKVLGTEVLFVDPAVEQWGLKNILVAIGGDIIEVVSPFRENTTVSRLLSKRDDGGYMIIMQTEDARARRKYLESTKQAACIFMHESDDAVCIQYHPKGIKGGIMPELDSHTPSSTNPTPIETPLSPWHACGPLSTWPTYSAGMKKNRDLHLLSATCRLAPGDTSTSSAAKQWERLFGVRADEANCAFTNAKLHFIPGEEGCSGGLTEIKIGVDSTERLDAIYSNAKAEGLLLNGDDVVSMLGIRWQFQIVRGDDTRSRL